MDLVALVGRRLDCEVDKNEKTVFEDLSYGVLDSLPFVGRRDVFTAQFCEIRYHVEWLYNIYLAGDLRRICGSPKRSDFYQEDHAVECLNSFVVSTHALQCNVFAFVGKVGCVYLDCLRDCDQHQIQGKNSTILHSHPRERPPTISSLFGSCSVQREDLQNWWD